MLALTQARIKAGWGYRIAGYRLQHFDVTRKIDWDDPDSVPMWEVKRSGKRLFSCLTCDEAMNFAEATYELEQAE